MKKRWWRHVHVTKCCLWADKQNDVSQLKDVLHPELNYIIIVFKRELIWMSSENSVFTIFYIRWCMAVRSLEKWQLLSIRLMWLSIWFCHLIIWLRILCFEFSSEFAIYDILPCTDATFQFWLYITFILDVTLVRIGYQLININLSCDRDVINVCHDLIYKLKFVI